MITIKKKTGPVRSCRTGPYIFNGNGTHLKLAGSKANVASRPDLYGVREFAPACFRATLASSGLIALDPMLQSGGEPPHSKMSCAAAQARPTLRDCRSRRR
jgi:hypothetical protein